MLTWSKTGSAETGSPAASASASSSSNHDLHMEKEKEGMLAPSAKQVGGQRRKRANTGRGGESYARGDDEGGEGLHALLPLQLRTRRLLHINQGWMGRSRGLRRGVDMR